MSNDKPMKPTKVSLTNNMATGQLQATSSCPTSTVFSISLIDITTHNFRVQRVNTHLPIKLYISSARVMHFYMTAATFAMYICVLCCSPLNVRMSKCIDAIFSKLLTCAHVCMLPQLPGEYSRKGSSIWYYTEKSRHVHVHLQGFMQYQQKCRIGCYHLQTW